MRVFLPYGSSHITCEIPDSRLRAILSPKLPEAEEKTGEAIVRASLARPAGSPPLRELAGGKKNVVILSSDHTRPVPSAVIMPLLLEEIRAGNPGADITILVATGCHRSTTEDELEERYGTEIVRSVRIVVHDSLDENSLVSVGTLPSGGELVLNRLAVEADLLVAEGFIEPHFFAGFSGGRKSVLPGVAAYRTVLANHCAEFIASPGARTGILEGNPIHEDMVYAARKAGLAFICNVVLDPQKRITAAFSGDMEKAHEEGCAFLSRLAKVQAVPADIVITGNGGYPLDQNIYQAVKSMTAAEASCRPGGIIIEAAECRDGHGGEAFYHAFRDIPTARGVLDSILARGRDSTEPDQWEIQIFARILMNHTVILVTSAPRETAEYMNMKWAPSLQDALALAEEILGDGNAAVTVIPDGVSVIVDTPGK
ncbi:nickel-dependent lactate racemase [Aminivibrio pyruvatiphilus]|uniref:Nickel-dependent lactate racemase n=1 Tax=Aminivibrio pyruvatiphilus TaxID=1005740 RepID=A0A4R8MG99_9BACT|nr:nickel-dependent lactate racemase [Aminivibrio pyruvatiphilus]TDY64999.1 nickel-dependent lactate racemase [Aminivibrio pyruvatiphilus]